MTDQRIHELKTWPVYYRAILSGEKTFEIRYDDRSYEQGDLLHLMEWSPFGTLESGRGDYTGRHLCVKVIFVLRDGPGLLPNWVAMSIRRVNAVSDP